MNIDELLAILFVVSVFSIVSLLHFKMYIYYKIEEIRNKQPLQSYWHFLFLPSLTSLEKTIQYLFTFPYIREEMSITETRLLSQHKIVSISIVLIFGCWIVFFLMA